MATVINNPSENGSSAGWAVAVVVLIAFVLAALFVWPGYMRQQAPTPVPDVNVDVNLPTTGGETNPPGPAQ